MQTQKSTKLFPLRHAKKIWEYVKEAADGPVNTYGTYVIELKVESDIPVHVRLNSSANFKVRDVG